jgi:hypothetical protein
MRHSAKNASGCVLALLLVVGMTSATSGCGGTEIKAVEDGNYYGYDPLPNLSPEDSQAIWYHENVLTIRGKDVQLTKRPYSRSNGVVIAQPADGGFYTYKGNISAENGRTIVELHLESCEYCAVPDNEKLPSRVSRAYIVQSVPNALFEIDRVRYRASPDPSRHPSAAPKK